MQRKGDSSLPTYLCDLDVINPYFRSRDYEIQLREKEIHLIAPKGDLLKADLPIVTGEVSSVLMEYENQLIIDVGGDKDGALSLGQFSHQVKKRPYDFIFVVNINRPQVNSVESIVKCIGEIEGASRLRVTGIINNTHLGEGLIQPEDVLKGEMMAEHAAKELSIPFHFSSVAKETWVRWENEGIVPTAANKFEVFERKLLTPWNM